MEKRIPRIVVGAIQGRSGKTTFTIGLLRALRDMGYVVQPYKKGPDYIDPSWATYASGQKSRNLDAFMMADDQILHTLVQGSQHADFSVIEGAMGIFDGFDVEGSNSTAQMAKLTQTPVILVVSGQRITRSVAALINGVIAFDPDIHIAGVILNQVARPRHLNIMTKSIETYCDVPILGALPKSREVEIPDRHLGLIPAHEQVSLAQRIEALGDLVRQHVDIDKVLDVGRQAPALTDPVPPRPVKVRSFRPKIGVFQDRAFSFYYPENLEALEREGADLVAINALEDTDLEGIDGLYIGGGFPEVMAAELAANTAMRQAVKDFALAGKPIYAECGGLMYLSQEIETQEGHFPMVGVIPGRVRMEGKPQGHGYAIQKIRPGNPYFPEGSLLRGHEFHHSRVIFDQVPDLEAFGFETQRGHGMVVQGDQRYCGWQKGQVFATYHHMHSSTCPDWASAFVEIAEASHKKDL